MANNQTTFLKYIFWIVPAIILLFVSGLFRLVQGQVAQNSGTPESLFKQANDFYQKRQYKEAVETYRQLLDSGYESGNLYYNLGNAYYKLKQKGMAVLYYQKAQRLIPGDADLKANLAYVQNKTGQSGRGTWDYQLNQFLAYLATIDQLAVTSSILFFILCGVLIYMILCPQRIRGNDGRLKPVWLYGTLSAAILFLAALSVTMITANELSKTKAVAVTPRAEVRFEPDPVATIYYELKEGAVIYIIKQKDGWALIKRPDGKRGWVESKNLIKI